jgi:hypothetical protein
MSDLDTLAAARAAGYAVNPAKLAASKRPGTQFHVMNRAHLQDGVADPSRPDGLVFRRNADGTATLVSAMYVSSFANGIPNWGAGYEWHTHAKSGRGSQITHIRLDGAPSIHHSH